MLNICVLIKFISFSKISEGIDEWLNFSGGSLDFGVVKVMQYPQDNTSFAQLRKVTGYLAVMMDQTTDVVLRTQNTVF